MGRKMQSYQNIVIHAMNAKIPAIIEKITNKATYSSDDKKSDINTIQLLLQENIRLYSTVRRPSHINLLPLAFAMMCQLLFKFGEVDISDNPIGLMLAVMLTAYATWSIQTKVNFEKQKAFISVFDFDKLPKTLTEDSLKKILSDLRGENALLKTINRTMRAEYAAVAFSYGIGNSVALNSQSFFADMFRPFGANIIRSQIWQTQNDYEQACKNYENFIRSNDRQLPLLQDCIEPNYLESSWFDAVIRYRDNNDYAIQQIHQHQAHMNRN